jgi:hypothetical protein
MLCLDCQLSENTPPTIYLKRNWILHETDPVGFVVERVYAEDNEQDELLYGLESISFNYNRVATTVSPLPFAINNATGIIYLNETLEGRVRFVNNFMLYIFPTIIQNFYRFNIYCKFLLKQTFSYLSEISLKFSY